MKKILLVCVILALTVGCSTKKVPYVTFIVGVSTGIRECIGAACALAFVNATLGLEDLEKKTEDKK